MSTVRVRSTFKMRDLKTVQGIRGVALLVGRYMVVHAQGDSYRGKIETAMRHAFPDDDPKELDAVIKGVRRQLFKWGFKVSGSGHDSLWIVKPEALENVDLDPPTKRQIREASEQTTGGPVKTYWECQECRARFVTERKRNSHYATHASYGGAAVVDAKVLEAVKAGARQGPDVVEATGIGRASVAKSLGRLHKARKLKRRGSGQSSTWYVPNGDPVKRMEAARAARKGRGPGQLRSLLVTEVRRTPGTTVRELAERVGVSEGQVNTSMRKAVAEGEVRVTTGENREHRFLPPKLYRKQEGFVPPKEQAGNGIPKELIAPADTGPVVEPRKPEPQVLEMENGRFIVVDGRLYRLEEVE